MASIPPTAAIADAEPCDAADASAGAKIAICGFAKGPVEAVIEGWTGSDGTPTGPLSMNLLPPLGVATSVP